MAQPNTGISRSVGADFLGIVPTTPECAVPPKAPGQCLAHLRHTGRTPSCESQSVPGSPFSSKRTPHPRPGRATRSKWLERQNDRRGQPRTIESAQVREAERKNCSAQYRLPTRHCRLFLPRWQGSRGKSHWSKVFDENATV